MNNIKIQDDGVTAIEKLPITYTVTEDITVTLESLQDNLVNKGAFLDEAKAQVATLQNEYDAIQAQIDAVTVQLPTRSLPVQSTKL